MRVLQHDLFYCSFRHYEKEKDIQMLALMSCMLAKQELPDDIKNSIDSRPLLENKVIQFAF